MYKLEIPMQKIRKSTLNFQGNVDKSMEGQIEQIGLCLLTMGETRISDNSGNKSFFLSSDCCRSCLDVIFLLLIFSYFSLFWQSSHKEMNHDDYDKKSDKNLSVDPDLGQQHSHAPVGLVKFLSIDWEFPLHSVIFGRHIFWGIFRGFLQ